jgi:hypothetical protein
MRSLSVRRSNGTATVRASDHGVGGADPARGSGLRGLAARFEALNGRLDVDSVLGQGDLHQGGDPLRSREPVAGPAGAGRVDAPRRRR